MEGLGAIGFLGSDMRFAISLVREPDASYPLIG
jgi:hypothetical protein